MSTINGASAPAVKSCLNGTAVDFREIAKAALSQSTLLLERWLPGGRWEGHEYVVKNPTRADGSPGSFKINAKSGKWSDFATSEAVAISSTFALSSIGHRWPMRPRPSLRIWRLMDRRRKA